MNIIVGTQNLRRALVLTERLTSRNTTLPILQNLVLKTDGGRLKVAATNLEIGVVVTVGAKIGEAGEIAVPGRILNDLVSALTGDTITLATKQETISITTPNQTTKLLGTSTKEYPIIPKVSGGISAEIGAAIFKKTLAIVLESAAVADARPELSGVFLRCEKNKAVCATTDGFRLVERIIPATADKNFQIIIPRATAAEIVRIISDEDKTVTLRIGENQLAVLGENYEIISRLIDGTYPEYQRLIPEKGQARVLVARGELEQTIRLAGLFSSSVSDISITCEQDKIKISAANSDRGEAQAGVPAVLKGDPFAVSINYHYLLGGLKTIETEKVILEFSGQAGPLVLRPATEDKNLVYLVMPLRR